MDQSRRVVLPSFPKNTPRAMVVLFQCTVAAKSCVYVALRKSIHFREIFEWAFTDGVTTFVNMWLCCRQALIFWLNNFDYFTVWCLLLLCRLKCKLFKSTIMPVEVLISIVKDWYEWLVSGLVHFLSNDPFRRTGLMPCTALASSWTCLQRLILQNCVLKKCFLMIRPIGIVLFKWDLREF